MSILSLMPSHKGPPADGTSAPGSLWERLNQPDSAALLGLMSGAAWFAIGVIYGLTMSDELTTRTFFPASRRWSSAACGPRMST